MFRVIKSIKMNAMGGACGTCRIQERCMQGFLGGEGRPDRKRPLGRPKHGCKTIVKRILNKCDGNAWAGLIWLGTGTGDGRL
jgi:hypothetical protein